MQIRVWVVPCGGEEPGLDGAPVSHPFDATRTLGEPDIAKTPTEQPPLCAVVFREFAERAKATIHDCRIHPYAVVRAAQLIAPVEQRGDSERPHLRSPALEQPRVR